MPRQAGPVWKTWAARRLRQRTYAVTASRGPRCGGGDGDRAAGAGLVGLGPAQVHQEAVVGGDNVGGVEAVQVVGAQRTLPPDEQQGGIAGVGQVLVGVQVFEDRGHIRRRSALRRRDGAKVGWRRIPVRTHRNASCRAGLATSPTALATVAALGTTAAGVSAAGMAAAGWAAETAVR
jgi:hypothetical protein